MPVVAPPPSHLAWIADRDEAAWAPFGIASLVATHWLDGTARPFDGAPGLWHTDGQAVIGVRDAEGDVESNVRLLPGSELRHGQVLLRAMERDGMIALRVLDPDGAARRGISEISRHPYDPAAAVRGEFRAGDPVEVGTESVDGHRSSTIHDGVVAFEWEGTPVSLDVDVEDDGSLFAVFADATAGGESYRFRFLRMPAPGDDGIVDIDLNRAYLPPCAFSDHYVCVLPSSGNRWGIAVRAGEALVD